MSKERRLSFGNLRANIWGWLFMRQLHRELRRSFPEHYPQLLVRIRATAQKIFNAGMAGSSDRQPVKMLALCSLILGAYRELLAESGDSSRAFEIARVAFRRTFQKPIRLAARAMLWLLRDPVRSLSRKALQDSPYKAAESGLEMEQRVNDDGMTIIVTRCACHQFFNRCGEPSLTRIFCEWDRNWMDEVEASRRPIRIERPIALSTGGDHCSFRFVRDPDKHGEAEKTSPDIVLGQGDDPERKNSSLG